MNPIIFNILFKKVKKNFQVERVCYSNEWSQRIEELSETQFQEHFQMRKIQFSGIEEILFSHAKNIGQGEFRHRLLVTLTYISHKVAYRMIRELFGLLLSSAFRKINYILDFIQTNSHYFIKLSGLRELESLSDGFNSMSPTRGTILSIDVTLMPNQKPRVDGDKYYYRKKYFALNLIMLYHYKKRIRFITAGYGRCHDVRVYRNSNSLQNYIEGLPEYYWVVGDSAFRGLANIKVGDTLVREQPVLANNLQKHRPLIERTYGLLKEKFRRWKILNRTENSTNI